MNDGSWIPTVFVGTWIALGFSSFCFFTFNRNVSLKKRILPLINYGSCLLFLAFGLLISRDALFLLFVTAAVVLIGFLNSRIINFCDACGRTLYKKVLFEKAEFCSKCGARLKAARSPNDNTPDGRP
jgi:hypothetical protein